MPLPSMKMPLFSRRTPRTAFSASKRSAQGSLFIFAQYAQAFSNRQASSS
ncbi:hypothetical protein [Gordonibacter pamelaeae]|nr:hypothetical protein [Gordonibacter pamelaeae]